MGDRKSAYDANGSARQQGCSHADKGHYHCCSDQQADCGDADA
jgi:hypothetical protein